MWYMSTYIKNKNYLEEIKFLKNVFIFEKSLSQSISWIINGKRSKSLFEMKIYTRQEVINSLVY